MNIKSKLVAAFALVVFVLPGITFASVAQTTPTVAQLQAQIAALLAVVQSLEAQLAALNGSAKACPTWGCNGPSPVVPIVGTTTTTPSVTVLWPNGGEVLNDNGSSNLGTIKWITANFGSLNIEIDLMDSSGNILKAIATGIPNVGSYAWASDPTIPNGSYKIRISSEDKGTSASDSSNGFFQITGSPLGTNANPSLVIEVPNAGSGYVEGQPMTVEWNESGVTPENVRISLMNGAGALTTLASLGASTVSSWTGIVPSNIPAGSNYVIIVCDENVPSPVANAKPLCANSPNISIAPRLGIVANPAFASGDVTAGTIGARIGSYVISAPNVEALQLKNISITDGMSAADFQNFRVLVNGTQFGPTQALSSSNQNFQGSVIIPANGSVIVDVLADVLSSAPAGNQNTTAIYANGVGQTTFASYTSPGSSIVGQTMTVTGGTITVSTPTSSVGGILTASISPNTPASSYVGMGITGVHVVQYQFTANASGNEDLTQLNMTDVAGSRDYGTFINYRLTDASGNVLSTAAETTNGTLVFNLTGLNIPSNSTAYVNLVADVNAYPYATSGAQHAFVLNSFQYSNAAGANTAQPTNGSNNRTFTVYQTTLNAMGASFVNPTSVSTVGNTVGEFTFTVGSGNISPTVKTITLSTTGSLIQSGTAQTLGLYDAAAPSVLLASEAMSGTNSATFNITAAMPTSGPSHLALQRHCL